MKNNEDMAEKEDGSVHKTKVSSSNEKDCSSGYDEGMNSSDLNKKEVFNEEKREDDTTDYNTSDKKGEAEHKIIYTNQKLEKYSEEEKAEEFESHEKENASRKHDKELSNKEKINDIQNNVGNERSRSSMVCNSGVKEKYIRDDGNETDLTKGEKDSSSSNEGKNVAEDINNPREPKQENNFEHNINVGASSSGAKYYSLNNDTERNRYNSDKNNDLSNPDEDSDDVAAKNKKGRIASYSENDITRYSSDKKNGAHGQEAKGGSVDDLMNYSYNSDDSDGMKVPSPVVSHINIFLDDVIDKLEQPRDATAMKRTPFSSTVRQDSRKSLDFEVKPCNSCEFLQPVEEEKTGCCGLCKKGIKRYLEFWIISVPELDDTWTSLNAETRRKNLSQNYKFHIPQLKVGVLNDLMSLTEQLLTLDNYVKEVVEKVCENTPRKKSSVDGKIENFEIYDLNAETYLTRFTWNNSKYSSKQPVRNISDIIFSKVQLNEKMLKEKISLFEEYKASLSKYERREQEPLQNRFLGDIVKKEHFVLSSKYLTTLLVVVPKDKVKLWWKSYESICDNVVPKSSNQIFDDGSHCLFNVTIYRNKVEEFTTNARKMKFVVREFQFSEKKLATEKEHIKQLSRMKSKYRSSLCRFANICFVECFEAWIHVKALRIFVESVVRYGFPVNFQAMLIQPRKSKTELKRVLQRLYSKADVSLASGSLPDIPGNLTAFNVHEYYPYVFLKIGLNFLYKNKK